MGLRSFALFVVMVAFLPIALRAKERIMPAFAPQSPVIAGQGGAFTASASGYESLFTNPAGFASSDPTFTALSLNPWLSVDPLKLPRLFGLSGQGENWDENIAGGGFAIGLGYVGKGLGLGFIASGDSLFMDHPDAEGVSGTVLADFSIIGGLAFTPIQNDLFTLSLGANLRPGIRFYAPLDSQVVEAYREADGSEARTEALNSASVYQGAALAFDAGLIMRFGRSLSLGFSVRDLMGTRYAMSEYPLGTWLEFLSSEGLKDGGPRANDVFYVPPSFSLGISYEPRAFMPSWLSLKLQAEHSFTQDSLPTLGDFQGEPWKPLQLGVETRFFTHLALRAGLDRGVGTVGFGFRLFFMDFNVAFREQAVILEWALRF